MRSEAVLARAWKRANSAHREPEGFLEDALAAALEDRRLWSRMVRHFGWPLPTEPYTIDQQAVVKDGRTDLRLRFEGGQRVVLELKADQAPSDRQLIRYAEPQVSVIGIARSPAVYLAGRAVGCISWSALVALPWPDPPLPWLQFCALAREMGVAMPQVDLSALSGLVASYDGDTQITSWVRAASNHVAARLNTPTTPWIVKSGPRGRYWVERAWRRKVGWSWLKPWRRSTAIGAFVGLSYGRRDVPLIVAGLPDLILVWTASPSCALGRRLAQDPAVLRAVEAWQAQPHAGVREWHPGGTEPIRARLSTAALLQAENPESAFLQWVDEQLEAWATCGLIAALQALVAIPVPAVEEGEDPAELNEEESA